MTVARVALAVYVAAAVGLGLVIVYDVLRAVT